MLDRIIPGLTVLLRQAGMRCHPAHPLLAPLRAIDHLRQVFVQDASLRIDSYGDQWLRTIPPAASRLLQSAVGKQLRQETWDRHIAAEAVLSDSNLLRTDPTVSAAASRCCSQTCTALLNPLPFHVAGFLLQGAGWKGGHAYAFCPDGDAASGASFQCSASSISQTHPIGASGFAGQLWRDSAASVPQCAERLEGEGLLLFEKQVCSRVAFQLERLFTGQTVPPLVSCRPGSSQT